MTDRELVQGCADEWEPGERMMPRWLAVVLAVAGAAVVTSLLTAALIVYDLIGER